MTWATIADCTAVTGTTPTAETLALAQSMVEDYVDREPSVELTTRDAAALRKAVAYQAAWLPGQPDILSRVKAKSLSQDGMSVTFDHAADQFLSPFAQRAIKRLSWMGTRSVWTGGPVAAGSLNSPEAFLHSGADSEDGWEEL